MRNLWLLGPEPLRGEDHYASYPSELVRRTIKAGTSEKGCCATCGAPWRRVTEKTPMVIARSDYGVKAGTRTAPSGTMVPAPSSRTVGWEPSCKCQVAACITCGIVLELPHGKEVTSTNQGVSDLRQAVPSVGQAASPVQSGVLRPEPPATNGEVRGLQQGVSAEAARRPLLWGELRDDVGSAPEAEHAGLVSDDQGVRSDLGTEASAGEQAGLRDAAPPSDGADAWAPAPAGRGSASQERHQGRQPAGKPGVDGQTRARRAPQSPLHGDMPVLRPHLPGSGQCPHCGGELKLASPSTVPCRVLDCFGGSGTTGIVADQLGRDCTLIELKPEYAAMSERRVKGDSPLFAEVERVK